MKGKNRSKGLCSLIGTTLLLVLLDGLFITPINSMEWGSLLGSSRALSELSQYPDVRLYKAASMLTPEERPTVPVRLYDNPDEAMRLYGMEASPQGMGFASPKKDSIYINRKGRSYKNKRELAGMLSHEQGHILGMKENEARAREANTLERLQYNPEYVASLRRLYR